MNKNVPVLECVNISKFFQSKNDYIKVLKQINLRIFKNDFVVILGPSGSGKTTLLNILAGLEKPSSGHICVDGQVISQEKDNKEADQRRAKKFSYVFQNYGLIPILNVYDNVCLGLVNQKPNQKVLLDILKRLKIDQLINKFPHELSGGQQQRVAIARSLIKNPELIFCDEPTGALDNETTLEMFALFKELKKEDKTIVVVTHDERFISLATRVIRIKDGMISNPDIYSSSTTDIYSKTCDHITDKAKNTEEKIFFQTMKAIHTYNKQPKNIKNNKPITQFQKRKEFITYRCKAPSNIPCIKLTNINKTVSQKRGIEQQIIKGINLTINKGDFVVIHGESGSGKSTLLGIMSGLDPHYNGKVEILGSLITEMSNKKLVNFRKENISFIFQDNCLLPDLTSLENVLLLGDKSQTQEAIDLLTYLGLDKQINTQIKYLSGGQQQRVAIARSLITHPKILFADEPTGATDSKTSDEIVKMFKYVNSTSDTTIIMVTHNKDLFKIGNKTIGIKDGQIYDYHENAFSLIPK